MTEAVLFFNKRRRSLFIYLVASGLICTCGIFLEHLLLGCVNSLVVTCSVRCSEACEILVP